jgi:hypothetical protein
MNVPTTIDAGAWLSKYLEGANGDTDLARSVLGAFAEAIMSAQASMQCNAGYAERTTERENSRNGYRTRPWDTRVGTIELNVPKLRRGVSRPRGAPQPAQACRTCTGSGDLPGLRRGGLHSSRRRPRQGHGHRGERSPRSRAWPKSSTPSSPSSRNAPSTGVPIATCGSTR